MNETKAKPTRQSGRITAAQRSALTFAIERHTCEGKRWFIGWDSAINNRTIRALHEHGLIEESPRVYRDRYVRWRVTAAGRQVLNGRRAET